MNFMRRLRQRRRATVIKRELYPIRAQGLVANELIAVCNRLLILGVKPDLIEGGLKTTWKKAKDLQNGRSKK